MATFVLEDLGAAVEVMVFPKTMAQYGELLDEDAIVCVKGRLDTREDTPKIIAMEITRARARARRRPAGAAAGEARRAHRRQDRAAARRSSPSTRATVPVFVHLESPEKTTVLRLGDEHLVGDRNGLLAELRVLLGADCIA